MQNLNKPKILAVDDDNRNLYILEQLLTEFYKVQTVESGEKAWDVVSSFQPDIILLDIMMPGMDGFELCKKIKNDERLKFIKIIMVSGKSSLKSRLKSYEEGADDYIAKPFESEELLAKIKVFLRLKHFEEVDSLKSNFLNLISHETKTPISQILGYSELLLNSEINDDQKEWIQTIVKATNILHENSNKILLLSQLKKGFKVQKEKQSIKDLVRSVIQQIDPKKTDNKKINFDYDSSEDIAIDASPALFSQALGFVIDNAIRFSPGSGLVKIEWEILESKINIKISDQGPGIAAKPISDIFNEFGEKDILHHQEGLRISLSIARAIVESHGGSLSAFNNSDKGATFIFQLPFS